MKPCLTQFAMCALLGAAGLPPAAQAQAAHEEALPLSGAAYRIATQAYRDYDQGNYTQAIRNVQEAIRLRPDVPRLHDLLREAQHARQQHYQGQNGASGSAKSAAGAVRRASGAAQGGAPWLSRASPLQQQERYAAALEVIEQGLRTAGPLPALQERRNQLRALAAQQAGAQAGAQAIAADEAGDSDSAIKAVRSAIGYAPQAAGYRLLLVKLLLQGGDLTGAYSQARQSIALDEEDAMAQAYAGYLLQRRGELAPARALFHQAANGDALGDADLRNLRLIGADAALAAGDGAAAMNLLAALDDSDAEAQQRRRLALSMSEPGSTYRPELSAPTLRCVVNRFGPVCSLFPAGAPAQTLAAGAYRAAGAKRLTEALALIDEAIRIGGATPELGAQKDATRRMVAREHAAAAFQAIADNQPALARQATTLAIEFAPDVMAYRMMLIDTLLRQQQYQAAEQVAEQAIASDPRDPTPQAMRGYVRQLGEHFSAARDDYQAALRNDTLSEGDRRNLALFIADAAAAGGDHGLANDTLASLPANDQQALWRRRLLAANGYHPPLQAPALDYRGTPYDTVCTLRASDYASNALVEAIYRSMGRRQHQLAVEQARQLVALAPDNQNYQRILAQALDGAGQQLQAGAITAALRDPVPGLEFAYLAQAVHAPLLASQTFSQIDAAGKLPARSLQDAGFAALNANLRPDAERYFRRAIDAAHAGELPLTAQQMFDTRRAVAELEREWGGYASANYRGDNPQSGPGANTGLGDSLEVGAEAYWRPSRFNRNGRYIDLYGRLNGTGYSSDDNIATGAGSLQAAFGMRAKPLAGQNLVLAFERLVPLGAAAQADWLARAGYSYGLGTDLRVGAPSWNTAQLFAEAGRYLHAGINYVTSEGQLGRSYLAPAAWSRNTTINPYAVLGADYNQGFAHPGAVGAGVGVTARHWFREDRYRAPRSSFEVTAQYRFRVSGDDRAGGLILRATLTY